MSIAGPFHLVRKPYKRPQAEFDPSLAEEMRKSDALTNQATTAGYF